MSDNTITLKTLSVKRQELPVHRIILAPLSDYTPVLVIDAWSALGAAPSGDRLKRIEQSPQFRGGQFHNFLPQLSDRPSLSRMWEFFTGGSAHRKPGAPLPVIQRRSEDFADAPSRFRVTWLGHSSLLLEVEGVRLLVDPVWGKRASPSRLIGTPRFYPPPIAMDELPSLDAVVLSHDHYDHLDVSAVRALRDRVPLWVTPLGLGAHLEAWGVDPAAIRELDWWDEARIGSIRLVSTPARHFSGRSLRDRNATLWSGWAFIGSTCRLWCSGDSGLTPDFLDVGERLGPFDVTFIESGAYDLAWPDVHMGPEQAVVAHQMVGGAVLVPVHWGLFNLAMHGWTEPAERIRAAANTVGVQVAFPRPGESVSPGTFPSEQWWPSLPWHTAAESPIISTGLPASVLDMIPRP